MFKWRSWNTIEKSEREWMDDARPRCDTIGASPRTAWLDSRVTLLLVAAAFIAGFGLTTSAAAQVLNQPPAVNPYTLTPEQIAASVAGVVALIGAVFGGLALARSAGRIGAGNGRRGAIVALVMGPIGIVIGGLVVATADGGWAPAMAWVVGLSPWWWG